MSSGNVSMSGMQVACPSFLYGLVQPVLDQRRVRFSVEFPDQGNLEVTGEVLYVSHYGYEHLIGLRFLEFHPDDAPLRRYCRERGADCDGSVY